MPTVRHLACKTNPVQRARGGNAVAAAAYRAGENLRDEASQRTHRYAGRAPDVEGSTIRTVEGAPDWHHDRAALWNSAEAAETRKDARTARDLVLGLAWELTPEERRAAVFAFADREFVARGHVVDIAFHRYGGPVREGDRVFDQKSGQYITGAEKIEQWRQAGLPFLDAHKLHDVDMPHVKIERSRGGDVSGYKLYQPHAHVLVSARAWDTETGAWAGKKDPHFDKPKTAKDWRYDWPKLQNEYLKAAGWDVEISCTASESDEPLPLKSETLPNQAYHMERRDYAKEPTTADQTATLNRFHNEAIRHASEGLATKDTPEGAEDAHRARVGGWWRNMARHADTWRDDLSEAAQEWRHRFEQHRTRIRTLFGRDMPEHETPKPDRGQEPEL